MSREGAGLESAQTRTHTHTHASGSVYRTSGASTRRSCSHRSPHDDDLHHHHHCSSTRQLTAGPVGPDRLAQIDSDSRWPQHALLVSPSNDPNLNEGAMCGHTHTPPARAYTYVLTHTPMRKTRKSVRPTMMSLAAGDRATRLGARRTKTTRATISRAAYMCCFICTNSPTRAQLTQHNRLAAIGADEISLSRPAL